MTVSSQTARNDYIGNGVTVLFPVTFRFLANTHLRVFRTVIATNVTTELVLDSLGANGFSVTGAGQPAGGIVTVITPPANQTERISILRNMPFTQLIDYIANDAFPAESHERALDERTMENQQMLEVVGRAITLPPQTSGVNTDLPAPTALNLLRWNAAENALENATPPAIATVANGAVVDATVSPIAGILGSKLNFLQAGAFAVNRTVQEKQRESVSVRDFGATGDGITDDTVSIQRAFDAMATAGQGCVYFPKGIYKISAELIATFTGKIYGDGIFSSVINASNAGQNIIRNNYAGYLEITGLDFGTTVVKTGGAAIRVEGSGAGASVQNRIHHCRFLNQYISIDMGNASFWTISDNFIGESVLYGIRVDNTQNYDAGDNTIIGNVIQRTGVTAGTTGIFHVASGGTKVIGNKILGHQRGYQLIPRVGAVSIIDTQVVGNSMELMDQCIYFDTPNVGTGGGQIVITGNQLAPNAAGIVMSGSFNGVVINSNQIALNYVNVVGIYTGPSAAGSPGQVLVSGNQTTGNASAGSSGIHGGNNASVSVHANYIIGAAIPYNSISGRITDATFTFANLPSAANGSIVYCSDGTIASPVAGGGTGCIAKRINGIWVGN